jgi:hypothetical protein
MTDGGRNAARGFRHLYVRTLEFDLAVLIDPEAFGRGNEDRSVVMSR